MTYSNATKNERWSAMGSTEEDGFKTSPSTRNEPMSSKRSQHLRHILCQDFGTVPSFVRGGLPSQSLLRPMRMPSNDSLGSISTISSAESFASLANHRFAHVNNSKNNLLRYNNMGSKASLVGLNNRWRATPLTPNNSSSPSNENKPASYNMPMPVASGCHQRRWMATGDSDSGSDQPMGMITRKSSSSYLFPAKSA